MAYDFLEGVSCASVQACTGVGWSTNEGFDFSLLVSERWNGLTWEAQPIPSASEELFNLMEGVSCASAGACVAVGWPAPPDAHGNPWVTWVTLAERWDGTVWSIQRTRG